MKHEEKIEKLPKLQFYYHSKCCDNYKPPDPRISKTPNINSEKYTKTNHNEIACNQRENLKTSPTKKKHFIHRKIKKSV